MRNIRSGLPSSTMAIAGRLAGWINPWARKPNSAEIKNNENKFINKQDMYWDYRKYGDLDKSTNFLKLKVNNVRSSIPSSPESS